MKYIKFLILLSVSICLIEAQNDGPANTGLAFLKLPITSRALSMGEAVVSYSPDASSTFYNPAGLFTGPDVNAVFMHNAGVIGIRTEFLGARFKGNKLAFGISLNNTAVDNIQVREIPGPEQDEFNAQNFALGFSAAYKVNDMIQVGLTTKFLYEKIYVDNASGYGFDFGGSFHKDRISAGICLANLGKMSTMRSSGTNEPTSIRFGASYLLDFPNIGSGLRIAADGFKVLNGGKFHINSGAEFGYKDFLFIRAGYQTLYDDHSFTTGIGLKYKAFNLDYAFVPYKYSLGSSHTFTLGTSF